MKEETHRLIDACIMLVLAIYLSPENSKNDAQSKYYPSTNSRRQNSAKPSPSTMIEPYPPAFPTFYRVRYNNGSRAALSAFS